MASGKALNQAAHSEEQIDRYSHELYKCLKKDQLVKAKFTVKSLSREERKKVVGKTFDGNALLFIAAQQGQVHFINFLLDECMADIEQRGVYEVAEDRSRHKVTPLWCAAVANKLEVVKTFISHNANVNASSDTQSTPVRSACYMTNVEVVMYLVEHGADIHKPNVNGGTCLINSVQSVELCRFLIEKGADVNAQDSSGNTALHYAIREGRMETVKLLLKNNSDAYLKNDFGDDAIQTASLRGYPEIVSYLVSKLKPAAERQIEALELMGTNFVDEKHDIQAAVKMWKEAMELREQSGVVLSEPQYKPIPAYNFKTEATNMNDLLTTLADPESLYMQALLIRERILGPDHKDTIFGLMYRGAVYADTHHYQRCVDLWKYAFQLRHEKQEPLNHECLFTLQALCKLFLEIHEEHMGGFTNEAVVFDDVMGVFDMACTEVKAAYASICAASREGSSVPNPNPVAQGGISFGSSSGSSTNSFPHEEFNILLHLVLHMLHLLGRLPSNTNQALELRRHLHKLLKANIKDQEGRNLLHLSLDRKTSHVAEEYYATFPSLHVTSVLLECGADVNGMDNERNTPLHYCAMVMQRHLLDDKERDEVEKITELLIKTGVHPDARNKKGFIAGEGMPRWKKFYNREIVTLKCLSAHAVKKHKIKFEGEVPHSLIGFIEMH